MLLKGVNPHHRYDKEFDLKYQIKEFYLHLVVFTLVIASEAKQSLWIEIATGSYDPSQ